MTCDSWLLSLSEDCICKYCSANNFFWPLKNRKPLWRPQQMWPSNFMTPDHLTQDSLLISSIPARELDSFEMEENELAIRRNFWSLDWDIFKDIYRIYLKQRWGSPVFTLAYTQSCEIRHDWSDFPDWFSDYSILRHILQKWCTNTDLIEIFTRKSVPVASLNPRKLLCLFAFWRVWKKHESTLSSTWKACFLSDRKT